MADLNGIKVGVLGGGISSEREISLISAQEAYKALRRQNVETVFIDLTTSDPEKIKEAILFHNINIVFIALHGEFGEDGKIQQIIEELNIPYTGSPPAASYLSMDKISSKMIFNEAGVPTAPFQILEIGNDLPSNLKYPLVVKPYFAGSSIGVSIVRNKGDLESALERAFSLQSKVILEDYIEGRELTVGILEERPLAVVEIISKKEYFDFHTKYTDGMAKFKVPAELQNYIYTRVQEIGLKAHEALGCRHFSRVDIRLGKDEVPYVLEVNSIPGLTSHSLLPLSARCVGIDFDGLILKMTFLALDEKSKTQEIKD